MVPIKMKEIPDILLSYIGMIHNIKFPKQGYTSDAAIVTGKNGIFVLKRTKTKQYNEWLSHEAKILSNLSNLSNVLLPIPKIYDYVEQNTEMYNHQSWILMEYIQGNTIRDEMMKSNPRKYEIIYSFGETLAMIHNTSCPKEIKEKNKDWIQKKLDQAEYNLIHYSVAGDSELLEKLKRNKPNPIHKTFIHGDYTIDNVLINDGKVTGIIDWSFGDYGDPRYDISLAIRPKSNMFQTKEDYEAFFDGYGRFTLSEKEYKYFAEGLYDFF